MNIEEIANFVKNGLKAQKKVKGKLPDVVIETGRSLVKAGEARDKAWEAYGKARAALDKAGEAYGKAWAAHDKARAAYGKAGAARDKAWEAYGKAWEAYGKAWEAFDKALRDNKEIIEEIIEETIKR